MRTRKAIQIMKQGMRRNNRIVINWWTKDSDYIPKEIITRIDQNARKRIDTQIAKGKTIGSLIYTVQETDYECHWRIVSKDKNQV